MMTVLFWMLLIAFLLVCVILCFLVLIQSDKGGGISGTIGGGLGGASSLLGTQDTANILTKGTVIFGSVFFLLCILMSLVMSKREVSVEKSMLQKRAEQQQDYSPASVLDNQEGLPIRPAGEASEGAGLPAAAAPAAPDAPAAGAGAIPVKPSPQAPKQAAAPK
ncbi:MAG: preprotein translocase subunit SecG [Chitinispirillaceae bacterium]|nr:preprotein translocase subunit SecG [Chitinispirillaceae bacterium]